MNQMRSGGGAAATGAPQTATISLGQSISLQGGANSNASAGNPHYGGLNHSALATAAQNLQQFDGSAAASTLQSSSIHNSSSQAKKSAGSKPRVATVQGIASLHGPGLLVNQQVMNAGASQITASSGQRGGSDQATNASIILSQNQQYNQTAKLPQGYLNSTNFHPKNGGISNMTAALSAAGVHMPSSIPMNIINVSGGVDKSLSTSQKKRISLKKQAIQNDQSAESAAAAEYSKTIEQVGSPGASTLNLENMKKTQSLHYMRAASGASSPQQIKSRTSIGKYAPNGQLAIGMQIYNNYNNQGFQQQQQQQQQQARNSFVGAGNMNANNGQTAAGNRSRSKTTTRKKRNLYTSMGNYYQSQQPTGAGVPGVAGPNGPNNNNSASRVSKRVHQGGPGPQNFLENLEMTNQLIGGNLAVAHHMLLQEDIAKKRNKSTTKSYNNKELLDHNNSSEVCYSSHLTKKNPLTNNFFDVSQFSSNHNSIAKNFENSFQFSAGGFLPLGANSAKGQPQANASAVSANKQRPTSSNKTAVGGGGGAQLIAGLASANSSAKPATKKKAQTLRKSVNNVPTASIYNSNALMNSSANYGHLQQNAYDFLSNASLFLNSSKGGARRPKGGNSAIESRCSQNKDHVNGLGLVKSQVASNTAFGHHHGQQLNNTSHTTICSNRKIGNQGEIVSGKKNSLQQQMLQQNYISLAGGQHTSDRLTAGEISSDRQTLKMNDFLKQIEAYSNDRIDKFMPSMHNNNQGHGSVSTDGGAGPSGSVISNYNLSQQAKLAEQVKNVIDREMSAMLERTGSSKQRYNQNIEESREGENDCEDEEGDDQGEINQPDYEHILNVISESFNTLISSFYTNPPTVAVGVSLARIKESYEEIINSIVENLSTQIEAHQGDLEQLGEENAQLKDKNAQLEKEVLSHEKSLAQVSNFAKQNEALGKELSRLLEENKSLKKEQKDRDTQLVQSKKIIEQLSASQKQLHTQSNSSNIQQHNSSNSQYNQARQNESQISKNLGKLSSTSVPPLDLGKLRNQQQNMLNQPMLSNDSLKTLDKGLLNANLQDPSQSSAMNTVPHLDQSRMLDELYSNNQQQQPFNVNQSDISYVNSEENEADGEASYLNSGIQSHMVGGPLNQSGRLSQIAQDKSPIMKPFIPPLNLNSLNNRTQAARLGQPSQQASQEQQPQQLVQQKQKFKLDLSSVSQSQAQANPVPQQNVLVDQDSQDYKFQNQPQSHAPAPPKLGMPGGLGLNLANLKQQKGIVDFQDEFMAKYDEYSESWRNAMNKQKRF